jgi:hypothetical protein
MHCKDIVKKYLKELEINFITEPTDFGCHIITPFMGFNGEAIHFYVEEYDGFLRLSDAGNSLLDLKTLDIDISSGKEKEIYDEILRLYTVGESDGEIILDTKIDELSKKLIFYINALQSIYNLEFIKTPSRKKKFVQTIREYCIVNELKHLYLEKITIGNNIIEPIDLMSKDHKNLIQTVGTTVEIQSSMRKFAETKIIPFIYLELPKYKKFKDKYYRVIIYDETVDWDENTIYQMEEVSEEIITWDKTKKEKKLEKLLTV